AGFDLRDAGRADRIEDLNIQVVAVLQGHVVHLRDVGTVEEGADCRGLARYNRLPAVALGVLPAWGSRPADVSETVRRELPRLRNLLPPDFGLIAADGEAPSPGADVLTVDVAVPAGIRIDDLGRVLEQAEAALLVLKQPETGRALVEDVLSTVADEPDAA